MYLFHYILPLIIYYFYRNKIMLFGLIFANLIDLDHIFYRVIGKVNWFESACLYPGKQCSFGFYPLHNIYVFVIALIFALVFLIIILSFKYNLLNFKAHMEKLFKKKKYFIYIKTYFEFLFWFFIGLTIHFILDYIHLIIGFGF